MITLEIKRLGELQFDEIFSLDEDGLFVKKLNNEDGEMVICHQIGFMKNGRMKTSYDFNVEHIFYERQQVFVFSY